MDFYFLLTVVTALLEREQRVSYRLLRRELELDDGTLEDLRFELVEMRRVARDDGGNGLVWAGGESARSAPERPRALVPGPGSEASSPESTDPHRAPSGPGDAERRQLTVMFCDLVGSTALSTQMDPEDLRDVITAFQDRCRETIQRYGGFIARYMGDGMLVYFGYPRAHENDPERAVRTGLDVLAAMPGLNAEVGSRRGVVLAVRIGVATGPVVVGDIIGADAAEEAAVVGETPNLAARLQGVASPGELVIAPGTCELIGDRFELEDRGAHELKGFAGPTRAWRVVGERADAPSTESRLRSVSPLVGRQEELGLLQRAWEASREGRGQVVLIQGEAGIGKSRLLEALRSEMPAEQYLWVSVRASPFHTNTTLYPVIAHIERAVGWEPEDSPEAKLAKLEEGLQGQSQPLTEVLPLFAELLRLPLPAGPYAAVTLDPRRKREATLDAIVGWLLDEAERKPVLQIWEDLHWADPTSLELLGLYIEQSPTVPVLNVLTFRPEFVPPWARRSHMTPITLSRLERPEVESLIAHRAAGKTVPADVVEHIVAKADGVPLYVEELTKTILASAYLREDADRFTLVGALTELAIPTTLQDSLMARLDQAPTAREVAQLGAVLGREFAYEMLHSLAQLDEPALREGLGQLVEGELLYQRGRLPRARFIFKHALVHDAAYQSLLRRTRQQYHLRVAGLLEARFPETVASHPELLAHHFTEAGDATRAVALWRRAGERARELSANREAIGHFTKGLAVLQTLPDDQARAPVELPIQLALGHASVVAKGHGAEEVEVAYERARSLCQQLGDVPEMFASVFGLWRFYIVRRSTEDSTDLALQLQRLAKGDQAGVRRVLADYAVGFTNLAKGALAVGRDQLTVSLEGYAPAQRSAEPLYRAAQDPGTACLAYLALGEWLLGYPEQAQRRIEASLRLAAEIDDPVSEAHALCFGAIYSEAAGLEGQAREMAERAVAVASDKGFAAWVAFGEASLAWREFEVRHAVSDLNVLRERISRVPEIGVDLIAPYFLSLLARGFGCLGRYEEGLAALDQARACSATMGELWWAPELLRLRGELLLSRSTDAAGEAEACFEDAMAMAATQGAKSLELRAAMSLARSWQSQRAEERARDLLAPRLAALTEGFETPDLVAAGKLLDELGAPLLEAASD